MSQSRKEANYFKICRLLIHKGGIAFRGVLRTEISRSPPPSTLDSFLKANKKSLKKLRYGDKIINAKQWELLFPRSGSPTDSEQFDITLLALLLQSSGLSSPEILRIKKFRNDVYAHLPRPEIDDTEFERLWEEISKDLITLGILQQDIDELKKAPLSPEEESYKQEIKEWKECDYERISEREMVTIVEKGVAKLQPQNMKSFKIDKLAKFSFKGKRDQLSKKFQDNTRKWFLDDFEEWLNDKRSMVMILTAGPGVGKSVLSARICELYDKSGQLAACHFCDFKTSDYRDPYRILQSLASQMCDNVAGFRCKLAEALSREHSRDLLSDTFRVLLNDPLHALDRTEPMLIVVDALDETKTLVKSELLDLISDQFSQLPKWIKIFISSRPELQVRGKLEHLNPVEIRPDDDKHNLDLKQFIQCYFPSISEIDIESHVSKCEGSFLYAFYLVKEQVDSGNKPIVNVHIPKGISAFYEKQFERLKKDLQCYEQETGVSIFKNFLNVIAASEDPLPLRFLFACMDLSGERFEVRKTIVGIMSEILPVYDDCLTVFHKSLWDWLKLDGYEEHAYAADVADGKKRLWRACKKVYTDIDSLSSVSDFQVSPEKKYALENGVNYFVNVDGTEDWEWLVNVKVNYLKFSYGLKSVQRYLATRLLVILEEYKSGIPNVLFWHLFQLCTFLKINDLIFQNALVANMYLQHLANKQFSLVHNATTSKMLAREILNQASTIWLEEMTIETDSSFNIISYTFLEDNSYLSAICASPDNKLLAIISSQRGKGRDEVTVYELPSLKSIFKLDVDELTYKYYQCIVFSLDSSYFLLNSLQTCISIKNQSIVPFIPHGPAEILSSSFSSCGTRLVSVEEQSIKVWDVIRKELMTKSWRDFDHCPSITCFSDCMSYIFLFDYHYEQLNVFDSTALNQLEATKIGTYSTKLNDCMQIISRRSSTRFDPAHCLSINCWQLTTGQNVLCTRKHCSMPFVWKGRKCVLASCQTSYYNQLVIDTFQIGSLPSSDRINYIANLGENNFLVFVEDNFLLVLLLESSAGFPAFSFISDITYPIFCALSPDSLYVACSYGSPILKILNIDNGETVQTVAPKQKPIACWWSELYLWVICEGSVVVKYPYTSTQRNIMGNYVEECCLDCVGRVLKFEKGVLVCGQVYRKISISRICHNNLSWQQILDSKIGSFGEVAISSDGCAVLLYDIDHSCYELWEMGSENKWKLHSTGKLDPLTNCGCLAGKQNSRILLWLLRPKLNDPDFDFPGKSTLCSIDFSDATPENVAHELSIQLFIPEVIYVDPKLFICRNGSNIHFIHVPDGAVITSLFVGDIIECFFVLSKRLLFVFIGNGIIKHFKIHNIDKYLPPK